MAYGVYGDVIAQVPELAGLTYPTTGTLTTWIERNSNRVDGVLAAQGYAVPITDAEDVSTLTELVVAKVSCKAIYAATLGDDYKQKADAWCLEWSDFIEDLKAGNIVLTGQVPTKAGSGVLQIRRPNRTTRSGSW
jgi:hypothetical protein